MTATRGAAPRSIRSKKSRISFSGPPIRLLANPVFRTFADKYQTVKDKYSEAGSTHFRCDAQQATISAKLIDVASGDVIWIGNHTVTEFDGREIELEVGYERSVNNYASILNFVESNNTGKARIRRYGQEVTLPPFSYSTVVTDPRNLSVTECELGSRTMSDLQRSSEELASRAVAELIRTIRVVSEAGELHED